jgi:glycosyltransferase involved in cell wall biosynthesis
MNILHVIATLNPSSGGPTRVVCRLAAGQSELGHSVTIAAYVFTDPIEEFRGMTAKYPSFDKVRIVELKHAGIREAVFGSASRPVLRELVKNADIVHLHNVWESILRVAGDEAMRQGKPYVIEPNDILNPWSLRQKQLKKRIALALGYRKMIENSTAVLFGHSEEKRLVMQHGFKINPIVVALGGVFEEEVQPLPATGGFYRRYPKLNGQPFVVFLSRLHYKKGLDFLAEGFAVAARELPNIHLVVVGHDEGAQADFEQRIRNHKLEGRVHLVGPMHGEAKWQAYRDATCFILPSRDEAFTVAITEALAASLPVVISKSCHFTDVTEFQAGYEVDLDANSIGRALTTIVADTALRQNMSVAANRLFMERLSFRTVAKDIVNVYQKCVHEHRQRHK